MHAQKGPYLQRIPFLNEEQDDDAYPRFSSEDSFACERRGGLIAFLPSKQALFPKCWDDPLGLSQQAIAEQVGVAHSTVSRWLSCGMFPEQQPRPRKMELDAHLDYLRQRWEAGCHNIRELYRELVARGYSHSYWSVYEQLVRFLPSGRKNREAPNQLPRPPVLARQAVFLFLRRASELEADEQETLALLRSLHPEVEQAYELVQQFAQMLRTRTGGRLDDWLSSVRDSHIRELQGFVRSIERDKAAVLAGLTLPQSNGIVEGKVNKLKLIKRMGFGRAGFPLLRQRVLHAL